MLIEEGRLDSLIKQYKSLTDKEEKVLLLDQIIKENNGLIYKIVNSYLNEKFEPEELYQVASAAFIEAISNFKLDFGTSFSTYVFSYMDGMMKNFLRTNSRHMPLHYEAHRNFTNYKTAVVELTNIYHRRPYDKEVAEYLNKNNILYTKQSKWTEGRANYMKMIEAQTEMVHYNSPANDENETDMVELIEDHTIETPYEYANKTMYRESVDRIFDKYNSLNINDKVVNIIKLRYGYLNPYLKELIMQTIDRVGIENFGKISESEKLTLQQISFIYGITKENARVLSDIGLRQLQILAGTIPEIEIKEEHRFPFINRDLDIKPQQLNSIEFVKYDSDIININSKNGYINAKKQGDTNLVILDHINDREITYHIKVTPKYKDNKFNRRKEKKLALRKEANNE